MERQSEFGLANSTLQAKLSNGRIEQCGQKHIEANHEKGSRHQNREVKEISEVGHTHDRKGECAAGDSRPPRSFAAWIKQQTREIW